MATACSNPPRGRARWTLELLAGEMVKLTKHEDSHVRQSVGAGGKRAQALAKDMWCIPKVDASTSPAWRTCWICMPSSLIRSVRWCASMRAQPNWSARCASQSRPNRKARTLRLRVSPQQIAYAVGEVRCGTLVGDLHRTPGAMGILRLPDVPCRTGADEKPMANRTVVLSVDRGRP